MVRWIPRTTLSSLVVASALVASMAQAADDAPPDTASDESATPADKANGADASDATAPATDKKASVVSEAEAGDSPEEEPGKTYYFVGARYRGIIVPKFIENFFAEGGRTVYVNAFGPEFAIRKDNFEYNLSAWLALYNMDDTAFKGKNDPGTAWEMINSRLQLLYLTSDFLWSQQFTPEVGINYGFGAGLGIVFGNLTRTQSHPTSPGQSPSDYAKCNGPLDPDPVYCDTSNNHYGHAESSWANGGSKPNVFPWLTVQTGLRFKPSKSFAARLDLGFGTSGFFFGLGGDYGL